MIHDLESWLLRNYGKEVMSPDSNLGRMKEALSELVQKLNQKKIITIAGTNGKGETTLRLSTLLGSRSLVVWTSPHIESVCERFRTQDGLIDRDHLESIVLECHENLLARKIKLSYYEFLFFVFCHWADSQNPEYLLLEVGLGGRLDAVNVFDAGLMLLPSISRDHQEFLGPRYDGILKEKLGILRPGAMLISFLQLKYLRERAKVYSTSVGANHVELEDEFYLPNLNFSERNLLLAHAAYSFLIEGRINLTQEMAKECLKKLSPLPNRGEVLEGESSLVLYGSHNVDGMRKLIQLLHSDNYTFPRLPFAAVYVAFSRRDEQDLRTLLRILKGANVGEIRVTSFPHPKAMSAEAMEKLCRQEGLSFVRNIEEEFSRLPSGETSLVTGSYYFLGYIKSILRRR